VAATFLLVVLEDLALVTPWAQTSPLTVSKVASQYSDTFELLTFLSDRQLQQVNRRVPKQPILEDFILKTKPLFDFTKQNLLRICNSSPLKSSKGGLQIVISGLFWKLVFPFPLPTPKSVIVAILDFYQS
jgi:hypothetical protein